jgi:hypothetical protein
MQLLVADVRLRETPWSGGNAVSTPFRLHHVQPFPHISICHKGNGVQISASKNPFFQCYIQPNTKPIASYCVFPPHVFHVLPARFMKGKTWGCLSVLTIGCGRFFYPSMQHQPLENVWAHVQVAPFSFHNKAFLFLKQTNRHDHKLHIPKPWHSNSTPAPPPFLHRMQLGFSSEGRTPSHAH